MKLLLISTLVAAGLTIASSALVDESEATTANFKLIAGYHTLTRFTTLSSTTFKTCITELGQNALCSGRRKRETKAMLEDLMDADHVRDLHLDSSAGEDLAATSEDNKGSSGKVLLSLTSFTTLTTTSYFDNTATTVSVSFHCIPPDGINYGFC